MRFQWVLDKLGSERSGWSGLLIILGIFILAMVLGNLVTILFLVLVIGMTLGDSINMMQKLPALENGWLALVLGQGLASLIIFVCSTWFYWKIVERKSLTELNFKRFPGWGIVGLFIFIQALFLPFNGWLGAINEGMQLPASMKGLEEVLRAMEDSAAQMTNFITEITSLGRFVLAFVVIAVIAGVGEELLFRGLIQRKLYMITKSPHAAIWLAAFIFSAIHFQFYGFLPRLMLGAIFGYFYYFSGNIWVPIIAHIFNNGLAIVMLYLVQEGVISPEVEKMDSVPLGLALASLVMVIVGLVYMRLYKLGVKN